MSSASHTALHLTSGPPWNVELRVVSQGPSLACRIGCGEEPLPATVARSRWQEQRSRTACLRSRTAQERRIAVDVAHRLCKEAHRDVTCTVALEPRASGGADPIERVAHELAAAAGRRLRDVRLRSAVSDPGGMARLLEADRERLTSRVDELLATPLDAALGRHRRAIEHSRASRGREVLLFAPLYLSSACLNECIYCGFRRSAHTERLRLSVEQALSEACRLAEQGHRTLDLVTGEIPTDAFVDYVCEVCAVILRDSPIEKLNLNLGALTEEQYARLVAAGASGYHLYQETYDPEVYRRMHVGGPKQDMAYRLEGTRRALRAGFSALGLGVLLGLAPPRGDLARLASHAHLLLREFPGTRLGFSLPRIQPAAQDPDLARTARVDDETLVKALVFLRLEFPGAHLTLTTRESATLRDELLPLGITKLSAGVSTSPGGYATAGRSDAEQFSIRDRRSLDQVVGRVRARGLVPVFS